MALTTIVLPADMLISAVNCWDTARLESGFGMSSFDCSTTVISKLVGSRLPPLCVYDFLLKSVSFDAVIDYAVTNAQDHDLSSLLDNLNSEDTRTEFVVHTQVRCFGGHLPRFVQEGRRVYLTTGTRRILFARLVPLPDRVIELSNDGDSYIECLCRALLASDRSDRLQRVALLTSVVDTASTDAGRFHRLVKKKAEEVAVWGRLRSLIIELRDRIEDHVPYTIERTQMFDVATVNEINRTLRSRILQWVPAEGFSDAFFDDPAPGILSLTSIQAESSTSDSPADCSCRSLYDYSLTSSDLNLCIIRQALGLAHGMDTPVQNLIESIGRARLNTYTSYRTFLASVRRAFDDVRPMYLTPSFTEFPTPTRVFRASQFINLDNSTEYFLGRALPFKLPPSPTPMSTSLVPTVAYGFAEEGGVRMVLTIPSRFSHALVISGISQATDQAEVLLDAGCVITVENVGLDGSGEQLIEGSVSWDEDRVQSGGSGVPTYPILDVGVISPKNVTHILQELPREAFPVPIEVPGRVTTPRQTSVIQGAPHRNMIEVGGAIQRPYRVVGALAMILVTVTMSIFGGPTNL
jgi:hypothetical protein